MWYKWHYTPIQIDRTTPCHGFFGSVGNYTALKTSIFGSIEWEPDSHQVEEICS